MRIVVSINIPFPASYYGNGGAKFSKKIWLLLEFDRIGGLVRVRAFSNEALSVVSREPLVNRKPVFSGKECSLIF